MNSDVVNLVDGLWRFGNNKVWLVQAGMIGGTVNVDVNKLSHGLDEFLDRSQKRQQGRSSGCKALLGAWWDSTRSCSRQRLTWADWRKMRCQFK